MRDSLPSDMKRICIVTVGMNGLRNDLSKNRSPFILQCRVKADLKSRRCDWTIFKSLKSIYRIEVQKLSLFLQCAAQVAIINTYCFDLFNRSMFCSDYLVVERYGHLVLNPRIEFN